MRFQADEGGAGCGYGIMVHEEGGGDEECCQNATAHGLEDLSEEDNTRLFDWMQKGSVGGWLAGRAAVSAYSVRMQEALVAGMRDRDKFSK